MGEQLRTAEAPSDDELVRDLEDSLDPAERLRTAVDELQFREEEGEGEGLPPLPQQQPPPPPRNHAVAWRNSAMDERLANRRLAHAQQVRERAAAAGGGGTSATDNTPSTSATAERLLQELGPDSFWFQEPPLLPATAAATETPGKWDASPVAGSATGACGDGGTDGANEAAQAGPR